MRSSPAIAFCNIIAILILREIDIPLRREDVDHNRQHGGADGDHDEHLNEGEPGLRATIRAGKKVLTHAGYRVIMVPIRIFRVSPDRFLQETVTTTLLVLASGGLFGSMVTTR